MIVHDGGHPYKVGTVIAFDIGYYVEIGVITEIFTDDNGVLSCRIVQPSGRVRIRALKHDVETGGINQIGTRETPFLNTAEWIKRSETLY